MLRSIRHGVCAQMELGASLGMLFMAHIADPDTWFTTKYTDAARYGTKAQQYRPLERLGAEFTQPWIIAHMGGWPENLAFLDGLLTRRPNFYLDTSATEVDRARTLRAPAPNCSRSLEKWRRLLFGSDIVTMDPPHPRGRLPRHGRPPAAPTRPSTSTPAATGLH